MQKNGYGEFDHSGTLNEAIIYRYAIFFEDLFQGVVRKGRGGPISTGKKKKKKQ